MIHILLMILKVIGILLLVLAGILFLILICLLFVPICYRGQIKKEGESFSEIYAEGRISWLMGLLSARVRYENQETSFVLRILGIPFTSLQKAVRLLKKNTVPKQPVEEEQLGEEKDPEDKKIQKELWKESVTGKRTDTQKKEETTKNPLAISEKDSRKISAGIVQLLLMPFHFLLELLFLAIRVLLKALELPFRLLGRIEKISSFITKSKAKIRNWKKFLKSPVFREAIVHCKNELLFLLRRILPRKIEGSITFGFDDPSMTGEILGILGIFYGKLPKKLVLTPVFDREVLMGDITVRGHFYGITFLGIAWRIFRDKKIRKVIHKLKSKEA
ncbi:MAG: DUF2953 domain-containing protein [Lachnospiraceae bacterium]|nr:DUF2953 domain-containing protein [Lachnospiraceae bacterium]